MFSPLDAQCLAILHSAATSSVGIRLRTNNPMKARQALYRVRKDFGDISMADITIRASPDDTNGELWILRRSIAGAPTVDLKTNPEASL